MTGTLAASAGARATTEIANELNLSVKTASTYRSCVGEKMTLKTGADLRHYAIKNAVPD